MVKNPYKLEMIVDAEDVSAFFMCRARIGKLIEKGKPVPAEDLKEFVSYLTHAHTIVEEKILNEVRALTFETRSYFENTEYNFEVKRMEDVEFIHPPEYIVTDEPIEEVEVSYSLMGLLNMVFLNLKSFPTILEKPGLVIKHVYQLVDDYVPKTPKDEVLSEFKQRVLTGYILGNMGVLLSEDQFIESDKTGTYKKYLDGRVVYFIKKQEKLRQSRIK